MKLLDVITNFLSGKKEETETPDGYCPNCWGRTEYGGQFFEAVKNENLDANSLSDKKGWVQDYADKHLSGIRLASSNEGYVCPKCKVTYKSV